MHNKVLQVDRAQLAQKQAQMSPVYARPAPQPVYGVYNNAAFPVENHSEDIMELLERLPDVSRRQTDPQPAYQVGAYSPGGQVAAQASDMSVPGYNAMPANPPAPYSNRGLQQGGQPLGADPAVNLPPPPDNIFNPPGYADLASRFPDNNRFGPKLPPGVLPAPLASAVEPDQARGPSAQAALRNAGAGYGNHGNHRAAQQPAQARDYGAMPSQPQRQPQARPGQQQSNAADKLREAMRNEMEKIRARQEDDVNPKPSDDAKPPKP